MKNHFYNKLILTIGDLNKKIDTLEKRIVTLEWRTLTQRQEIKDLREGFDSNNNYFKKKEM